MSAYTAGHNRQPTFEEVTTPIPTSPVRLMTPDTLHPNDSVSNVHTNYSTPPPVDPFRSVSPSAYSQSTHTPHPYFAVPINESRTPPPALPEYTRDPSPYAPGTRAAPFDYEDNDPYKHPAEAGPTSYFFNNPTNRLSGDWLSHSKHRKTLGLLGVLPWFHYRRSIEQQIEDRRRGIHRQKWPILSIIIGIAIIIITAFQIANNKNETGSVFASGSANPMGGPTAANLIHQGARFRPCMTETNLSVQLPSFRDPDNPTSETMPLYELCGFGMSSTEEPSQSFRFVLPIILHSGILHLCINLFALLVLGAYAERVLGSLAFIIVFGAAGIFGNILGGNFAQVTTPSVGASGAILGLIAVSLVDLLFHWKLERRPGLLLTIHIIELIIMFFIGYIPNLDNFAHIGGWLQGLLLSVFFIPVISPTKKHRIVTIILRLAALAGSIVLFIVLAKNFYTDDPSDGCTWCKHLSCFTNCDSSTV
ncbi:rhomboid-domain-containing protein [Wallemia mellicola]|nr:rhomboid-domain-containing protein [Wallemia mellicola]TIC42890.1 rhomboid-domain-containing protein [Wallemia mellicola]